MSFQFQPYQSPFANSIAEMLLRRGDIAANRADRIGQIQGQAALQSGQGWAQALTGATNAVANIPQEMQKARILKQEGDLRDITLKGAQQRQAGEGAVDAMMRGDSLPATAEGPRQDSYLDANGLFDIGRMTKALGASGMGHLAPDLLKGAEAINDSTLKHQKLEEETAQAHAVMLGDTAAGALNLIKIGMPVDAAMDFAVQPLLATKRIKPEEYAQVKQQIAGLPPEQQQAALTQFMDQAAQISPKKTLKVGDVEMDRYDRTTAKGPAKPKTADELAYDLSSDDPAVRERAKTAINALHPPPARTAEQDDQRYRDIQARSSQGQPITPDDKAWAAAYEKQKTLATDKSASAAATRLAAVQAQQNDLQRKAQTFTEAQAGRKELTDKYEAPYLDAVEKAETLRSVIEAAKAGNQEAAALTPLLATLGVTTSEGVKRINMAEIATVQGAGSLFERIKGRIGKFATGQPLPADLQNDITKLADLLENSARKKYENGFETVTKRYGLKDETIRPKPEAAPASALTAGLDALKKRP